MTDHRVLGADVFAGAWVGIAITGDGFDAAYLAPTIDELVAAAGTVEVIAVDIPIGLPERGIRACDVEAKARVGARRSSVFLTPVRAAVYAEDYWTALKLNRESPGPGISRQAFSLRHKIRELDGWPERAEHRVLEAHPELSFLTMAGTPLRYPKKSWAGAAERRNLLWERGIMLPDDLGMAGRAAVDDVLDATAVAWTARRVARGIATGDATQFGWLPADVAAVPGRTDGVIWY